MATPLLDIDRSASPLAGTETILLVDDEPAVRNLLAPVLRDYGYQVIEATDGEDALLQAERHKAPIHLVVTDVVMPQLTGHELFDRLRQWYPHLRVLFMSGYTFGAIEVGGLTDDVTAFIEKPFTLNELGVIVRRLLDSRRS